MSPLKVALSAVLLTLAPAAASAQTRAPQNRPPAVNMAASSSRVVLSEGCGEVSACTPTAGTLQLLATATDPDGDRLLYTYLTTGGRISGDGANATLDLTGVAPGTYTVTVKVSDRKGGIASATTTVTVEYCFCHPPPLPPLCPTVDVSCPSEPVNQGSPLRFTASVTGGDPNATPTFNWTVSAGTIARGQGPGEITVETHGFPFGSAVTATVGVGGYERSCQTSASCSLVVEPPVRARKYDEYGVIPVGDEKLRLDNFVAELQSDPSAQGYLICYGGRRGRAGEARRRCERALNYVVSTRGVEASRVVAVGGGSRERLTVKVWLAPSGAEPPQPAPTATGRGRR